MPKGVEHSLDLDCDVLITEAKPSPMPKGVEPPEQHCLQTRKPT
ncbi:MAG TPA: hypothetical protein PLU80_09200 [Acidobacteriota bacterium]|nr:hypothetical protein [Acidobacteriota bacterium]